MSLVIPNLFTSQACSHFKLSGTHATIDYIITLRAHHYQETQQQSHQRQSSHAIRKILYLVLQVQSECYCLGLTFSRVTTLAAMLPKCSKSSCSNNMYYTQKFLTLFRPVYKYAVHLRFDDLLPESSNVKRDLSSTYTAPTRQITFSNPVPPVDTACLSRR